jgi:hypothetical protein
MFYKAKVAVCSEIRTKHTNAMWAPRRIFLCWTWWYVKLPLGFKRLIRLKTFRTSISTFCGTVNPSWQLIQTTPEHYTFICLLICTITRQTSTPQHWNALECNSKWNGHQNKHYQQNSKEISALLGHYAASSGSSVPTFRDTHRSHLQGPCTSWPLQMRPIGCTETSVQNDHSTLRNVPKDRISHYITAEAWNHTEFRRFIRKPKAKPSSGRQWCGREDDTRIDESRRSGCVEWIRLVQKWDSQRAVVSIIINL